MFPPLALIPPGFSLPGAGFEEVGAVASQTHQSASRKTQAAEGTNSRLKQDLHEVSKTIYQSLKYFEAASLANAEIETREITDAMFRTLPRELRDLIYEFYFSELVDAPLEYGDPLTVFLKTRPYMSDDLRDAYLYHRLPALLKERIVGMEVAQEAVQTVFRLWTFRFDGGNGSCKVDIPRDFLDLDYFGCGVMLGDHIKSIEISYLLNSETDASQNAETAGAWLQPLLNLPLQRKIKIRFDILTLSEGNESFLGALEPVFVRLREAGADLSIVHNL